jgi:hypothetical protein
MKLRNLLGGALLALLATPCLKAQTKNFPAQITFVNPIGTSGNKSTDYTYNFSINALAGTVGGIEGVQFGGLLNQTKGNVKGAEFGGLVNLTKGNINGGQFAGLLNKSDSVKGIQAGGLLNIASSVDGFQIGGITNISTDVKSYQVSGISNINKGEMKGFQVAGIANVNGGNAKGFQIGGIGNINNGDSEGFQIGGIFNKARTHKGFQIGLINIADSISGASIGLINIYKKGFYDEWELSFSDYANFKLSYKAGSKKLYTIYSVGATVLENNLWVAGIGLGRIVTINSKLAFQPELIYHMYFPDDFKNIRENNSTHLKLGLVYSVSDKIGLTFAPSIYARSQNLDKSNKSATDKVSPIAPVFSHTSTNHHERIEVGVGLSVGLILR